MLDSCTGSINESADGDQLYFDNLLLVSPHVSPHLFRSFRSFRAIVVFVIFVVLRVHTSCIPARVFSFRFLLFFLTCAAVRKCQCMFLIVFYA